MVPNGFPEVVAPGCAGLPSATELGKMVTSNEPIRVSREVQPAADSRSGACDLRV